MKLTDLQALCERAKDELDRAMRFGGFQSFPNHEKMKDAAVEALPALIKLWEAVADYQTWYKSYPLTESDKHAERQAANAIQSALRELEEI